VNTTRYASVLGLGFGDCGKGLFVDALARRRHAHTIVRFNGGAQAGHNVVTPDRHHTFSQFGAATFVPSVHTLLLDPAVVHPTALLVEAETLATAGVSDALSRLQIDGQCRLTTPFHQAAGRLRELLRGAACHGTCGVGVGETVRHALEHPEQVLRYADLTQPALQLEKLQAIRKTLLIELGAPCTIHNNPAFTTELQMLQDESLASRWLNAARALAIQCPPASAEAIHAQLTKAGTVLFEGAQGVLLDEWHGFHPHTTWSTISTTAVEKTLMRYHIHMPVEHFGVMRTYLTRHGAGPLPTEDRSLDPLLPEPHNAAQGWQGSFRRGHPDAVLLRYALESVGNLSGLFVSHLDVFARGVNLKWCEAYQTDTGSIERLPSAMEPDLDHQQVLTDLLLKATPVFDRAVIQSAPAFLDRLASVTPLPVRMTSLGNSDRDVTEL
jgi:adenylosuccinate synthase